MSYVAEQWIDEHYPRCIRCGLRTYVSNFSGRRVDTVVLSPSCPAYNETDRPEYPYIGSPHLVRD